LRKKAEKDENIRKMKEEDDRRLRIQKEKEENQKKEIQK
jgi:hypothetical protein